MKYFDYGGINQGEARIMGCFDLAKPRRIEFTIFSFCELFVLARERAFCGQRKSCIEVIPFEIAGIVARIHLSRVANRRVKIEPMQALFISVIQTFDDSEIDRMIAELSPYFVDTIQ